MKVLVTGASGFLGSWLARRLVQEGLDVRILKRETSNLDELQGLRCEYVSGDVSQVETLVEACREVDSVFHLAGLIAYSLGKRAEMEKINVGGTANVIEACRRQKVRKLVHLSSVVAVGASFDGAPLNEDSPYTVGHLNLGYFETKRKSEELVVQATRDGQIDSVILNPSTVYGAGDAKKGSRRIQLKVARHQFPFYTRGGVNVVAVEDVISGIIQAWKTGRSGERYILSGENILLKDLFTMIAEEAGVEPPRIYLPPPILHAIGKFGDLCESLGKKGPINSENAWTATLYHWFDNSKAKRELGFNPAPARNAVHNSIGWIREHGLLSAQLNPG